MNSRIGRPLLQKSESIVPLYDRGIHSIPKLSTSIWTFQLFKNTQLTNIPFTLRKVVGMRIQNVVWETAPFSLANNLLMWVICPEIYRSTGNQSGYMKSNPADPFSSNQFSVHRDIVATYVLVRPLAANNIPNIYAPNPEQPIFWFDEIAIFDKITLSLETDLEGLFIFDSSKRVMVTVQFFLNTDE